MKYICKYISVNCREPADILFAVDISGDNITEADILKSLIHDVAVDLQVCVQF